MTKLDLTKRYRSYYSASARPQLLEIGAVHYLSAEGQGDPSGDAFAASLQALYSVAYTLKFACKAEGNDFTVAKLEGQWWFDEGRHKAISMHEAPTLVPRSEWYYRLLIRLPDFVTEAACHQARDAAMKKKQLPLIAAVRYFRMEEGKVIQMLHTGPFDREPETLKHILQFSEEQGLQRNGLHHEIYLSDVRRTAPEKLKTILREPVR